MSNDFVGLRVIWPPDGSRLLNHEQDIIFVHGLHGGSLSDWQDGDEVCWPAEHLSLDLGNVRILAFGYDPTKPNVKSDGFYNGGLVFKQGQDLWTQLKIRRRSEKFQVPITLVGNDVGNIVVKSALCISHVMQQDFDPLLRKTKHILLFNPPPEHLTWEAWKQISEGAPGTKSRGQWRVWSAAHDDSTKSFEEIAHYFHITSTTTKAKDFARTSEYDSAIRSIRDNKSLVINDSGDIQRIRSWLERRQDEINVDSQQRNLAKHLPGTGEWLFQETKFREWVSLDEGHSVIWFVGPEGCGKSVLCSLAVERMRLNTQQQAVVYLMLTFDKPRSEYHLITQIALQLLAYVIEHRGGVDAEALLMLPKEQVEDKKSSQVHELIRVLISQCPAVFIFIDGLDEVGSEKEKEKQPQENFKLEKTQRSLHAVISFIAAMAQDETATPVRLWCSSKQTDTIDDWMRELKALELPVNRHSVTMDIAQYIEHRFKDGPHGSYAALITTSPISYLSKAAQNNFLFASMMADRLEQSSLTNHRFSEDAISNSSKGIPALYREQLEQLVRSSSSHQDSIRQKSLVALHIISLVIHAKRPLKLIELQKALAVSRQSLRVRSLLELSTTDIEQLDGHQVERDCAPFVDFHPMTANSRDGYVRLSHASAFVYLRDLSREEITGAEELHIKPNLLAHICLEYLVQIRYGDTSIDSIPTHSFYTYAAKYWHRHMEEAGSDPVLLQAAIDFMRSTRFLTMTRFQSYFFNRHFSSWLVKSLGKVQEESLSRSASVQEHLAKRVELQHLIDDYKHFISEWSDYLSLGTTYPIPAGLIESCWWGALGVHSALRIPGSSIEENQSFLLEVGTSKDSVSQNSDVSSEPRFYETLSHDGRRVAVWQISAQSLAKSQNSMEEKPRILRSSWYIDGDKPPLQYGTQEELIIDAQRCHMKSSRYGHIPEVPLITNPDTRPQVPAIEELAYGAVVRIGSRLFHREPGHGWTEGHAGDRKDLSRWDSFALREAWTIYSHRKQAGVDDEKDELGQQSSENGIDQGTLQPNIGQRVYELEGDTKSEVKSTHSRTEGSVIAEVESFSDDHIDLTSQTSQPTTSVSETSSDSELETSKMDDHAALGDSLSSAEDFCVDASDQASGSLYAVHSANDLWSSSDEDPVSVEDYSSTQDSEGVSDDDSDTASDTSESLGKRKRKQRYRLAESESHNMSTESSDADDEGSDSESEGKTNRQRDERPKQHIFSFTLYCDLCSANIVPYGYRSVDGKKEDRYYQCILCANNNCFDICSTCFGKGAWCKDPSHLLSECLLIFSERRYYWKDGISQNIANPLVRIVAGYEESEGLDPYPFKTSFRYNRRQASMLHGSQPVTHPNLPLVIYPLNGRELLFGNLEINTYFTIGIPFETFETAETGLNTCIPISMDLQFSSCGRYVNMLRFTARNDSLIGPIALRVVMFKISLSPKDPCSGMPTVLPFRQGTSLESWPRKVPRLPYTITWTKSHVYVSMNGGLLNVLRFPLDVTEFTSGDSKDIANKVRAFSRKVPLPRSALSTSVNFFPSEGNASAKIILGSLHGNEPRPPIVVYLASDQTDEWLPVHEKTREPPNLDRIREDALIEEPFWDEDEDLVAKATRGEDTPILEPMMPIRDRLLRQWQTNGIYCPSCFELGIKLGFFRPHPSIQFHNLDFVPTAGTAMKLEWRVSPSVFVGALEAGCQFCCYVAVRTLSFSHIRHTTQAIGRGGVRCCAKGTVAEDTKNIQKVIDNINKMDWKVPHDKRVIKFMCEPHHWNIENRSFDKLIITIPSIQVGGKFGEQHFAPTMITIRGSNELGESTTFTTFLHTTELSNPGTPECVLELHAPLNDGAHHLIDTRPLTTSRGEDENLEVIKSWIHTCQTSHAFCQQQENRSTDLPTRLVEIVDSRTIKLVETVGQSGQYVALSYCWGHKPTPEIMTTVTNLRARLSQDGLLREDLPGAIRDAVAVTERLKIKYIWIDSLCIIQDEREDKHLELGKMSQYYRNSFLTIAASTPNATTGFIGKTGRCEKHPDSSLPRDLVPLQVLAHVHDSKDAGIAGKMYVREENPYQLHEEPINKRAWTLQECILAPRVLLFGSRVIWFCQHMTHSDGGVEDWSFDRNDLERTRREFQVELCKANRTDLDNGSASGSTARRDVYNLWHRLVGTYSQRGLSYPTDKLPAISAVAAEFSKLTGDAYLAGLWRSNLPRDLLWTTPEAMTHRSKTWRAPTWSWVSVDDPILYDRLPPENATLLATVLEVETVPLTAVAPYGEVQHGSLMISAPSFPVKLEDEEGRKNFTEPWLKDFQFKPSKSEREMLLESLKRFNNSDDKDTEGGKEKREFRLPDEFFVVCIYGKRDELYRSNDTDMDLDDTTQQWSMWGLILKKTEDGHEEQGFERVLSFSNIVVTSDDSIFSRLERFRIV